MVLIVDDEQAISELIQDYILEEGLQALTTDGAEAALKIMEKGNITCVITDIAMPKVNGIELAKAIRKLHPKIKIICLSGLTDIMKSDLEEVKVDYLLQKPFRREELLDCVGKATNPLATI